MTTRVRWRTDVLGTIAKLDHFVGNRTRDLAKRIFHGVVLRSPVYTGSFRASWRVSLNTPDNSIVVGGSPRFPLAPPTFPNLPRLKAGDQVIISNSQPYAMRLEHGWSKQAPLGVLSLTLSSARSLMYV